MTAPEKSEIITRQEMAQWAFQQIIEGLCAGNGLYRIAQNIVDGVTNMQSQNQKAASK